MFNDGYDIARLSNESFFITIALALLIARIKQVYCRTMWQAMVTNFIGTVLHELAHLLVGWLLRARPRGFSVIPYRVDQGYVLGHVQFAGLRWWNTPPVALAPLLLLPLGYLVDRFFFAYFPLHLGTYFAYVFLLAVIIENALPSSTDFRLAARHPFACLMWTVAVGGVGWSILFTDVWRLVTGP